MMVLFFFFKQRTAYEMRISYWSSDVCSSDLGAKPEVEILLDDLGPSCQRAGDRLDRIGGDRLDLRQQRLHGVGTVLAVEQQPVEPARGAQFGRERDREGLPQPELDRSGSDRLLEVILVNASLAPMCQRSWTDAAGDDAPSV